MAKKKWVSFRVTEAEHDALAQAAVIAGDKSPSLYAARVLLASVGLSPTPSGPRGFAAMGAEAARAARAKRGPYRHRDGRFVRLIPVFRESEKS